MKFMFYNGDFSTDDKDNKTEIEVPLDSSKIIDLFEQGRVNANDLEQVSDNEIFKRFSEAGVDLKSLYVTNDERMQRQVNGMLASCIREIASVYNHLEQNNKLKKRHYSIPNTPPMHYVNEILDAGREGVKVVDENGTRALEARNKKINRKTQLKITENEHGQYTFDFKNRQDEITRIAVDNLNAISGKNQTVTKIFNYIINQTVEQGLDNGEIINREFTFPLQDFLKIGLYTNIDSARRGYNVARQIIGRLAIDYSNDQKEGTHPLFSAVDFNKGHGTCEIVLNDYFPWNQITAFYAYLPPYYWALSRNASIMLYNVCYLDRQNVKSVSKTGKFTIKLSTMQNYMMLPENTREVKKLVLNVMLEAAQEINEQDAKYTPGYYQIDFSKQGGLSTKEYIKTGTLIITVKDITESMKMQKKREIKQINGKIDAMVDAEYNDATEN